MHSLTCITRIFSKDGKKVNFSQERFCTPKGLHLVATLQVKEVKAFNTCSQKNLQQKLRKI